MPPTPKNVAYAKRLAAEVREKIRHGTFVYADYFPASAKATTGQGLLTRDHLDAWLKLQVGLESSTLKGYRTAVAFWKSTIGDKQLRGLVYSDILGALATRPDWSGKTRNNKASVLRQALMLAMADGVITSNPIAPLEAAEHQKAPPDPFDRDEMEAILAYMAEKYDPQVFNYFEAKFFTGLRTSESLATKWSSIDFRLKHLQVSEAIVLGEHKDRTKTNRIRLVDLNSRALAALQRQKVHTFMAGDLVFVDPRTRERWTDDEPPREMYWRPALKRLGIRYRSPYNTRHTYATMMLMAGVTPAYAAAQLGHSIDMFLTTYAKWIDGGRNAVEQGKLEQLISPASPQVSKEST
jgi:integrase